MDRCYHIKGTKGHFPGLDCSVLSFNGFPQGILAMNGLAPVNGFTFDARPNKSKSVTKIKINKKHTELFLIHLI